MRLGGFLLGLFLLSAACGQPVARTASVTSSPLASPAPSQLASPTPMAQALDVPDGTPVILFHDAVTFDQLDGVTWDGATQGRIGAGVGGGGLATPQGTFYATGREIRARGDRIVAAYDSSSSEFFWADDGTHFCDVTRTATRNVASPGLLQLGAPGQAPRDVVRVGSFAPANLNAGGPVIIACSPSSDRAVVYASGGQGVGVAALWVIRLSTGKTVWTGGPGGWVVASHDGTLVALSPAPGQPTNIYGGDGKVVASLPTEVFGFSWDGQLAVTAGRFGATPSIIHWQDQSTIWSAPSSQLKYWQTFAEPGGSRIAVGVLDPAFPQTGGFAPVDLFVVAADGTTVLERKDVTLLDQ